MKVGRPFRARLGGGAAILVDSGESFSFGDKKRTLFLSHGSKFDEKGINVVDVPSPGRGYAKIPTPMMQMQDAKKTNDRRNVHKHRLKEKHELLYTELRRIFRHKQHLHPSMVKQYAAIKSIKSVQSRRHFKNRARSRRSDWRIGTSQRLEWRLMGRLGANNGARMRQAILSATSDWPAGLSIFYIYFVHLYVRSILIYWYCQGLLFV